MAAGVTDGRVLSPRETEAVQRVEALKAAIDSHQATAGQVADAASAVLTCRDWKYLPGGGYETVGECLAAEGVWRQWEKARKPLERLVAGFLDNGLTQKETGQLLGISQARVSQLHGGKSGNEARARKDETASRVSAGQSLAQSSENISQAPDQPEQGKVTYIPPSAPVRARPGEIAPAPPPPPVAQAMTVTTEAPAPAPDIEAAREEGRQAERARFQAWWKEKGRPGMVALEEENERLKARLAGQLPEGASPCPECGGTGIEVTA